MAQHNIPYKHLFNLTPLEFKQKIFDIKLKYTPNKFQKRVHNSIAPIRVAAASARIGKTWLAKQEIINRMHYAKKQMIWCVGPTYEIARKVFREVWEYVHTAEGMKMFPLETAKRDKMKMVFVNGTTVEGKSTDNADSLLGEGVDFMVCDEASRIPQHIFTRYLLMRLVTSGGDLLLISTPNGKGNAFHDFYLQGQDPNNHLVESWMGTIYDNPLVTKEALEYIEKMKELDPIGYQQEALGMFVAHDGEVFPSFDKEVYFGKVPYDPNLPLMASIDHGFTNPFACLFFQQNGRQLRVISEYYVKNKGDVAHVAALKPVFDKYQIKKCVVDPREPNTRDTFSRLIKTCTFMPGPAKEIALGINIIRDHLQVVDDKPLLLADASNCPNLLLEFQKAKYKKDGSEEIVDKDNHALSAMRYYMLKYCNFLNRKDLSFFSGFDKEDMIESFSSIYTSSSEIYKQDQSIWMGNNGL